MKFLIVALVVILIIIIILRVDFRLGLRKQKRKAEKLILPPRMGNIRLLATGKNFYDQLFADIERAEHHIHLLWYIYQEDNISKQLSKLLIRKAQTGVEVRLLVDWFGAKLSKNSISQLREGGVSFAYSNVPRFPYLFFTLNNRNHRKITTIDGEIGYIGGFNIGDEYIGREKKFGFWRDFHLKLNGDGVQDLQAQFITDWRQATKEEIYGKRYFPPLKESQILLKFSVNNGSFLEEMFVGLIKQAKRSIMIGTPYYVPGNKVQNALLEARQRGVKVQLLVPKKSDYILIKEASYPYFNDLLHAGVEIYEYTKGFYHAKTIIIDEAVCDIGTANMDMRSFHLNNEINCLIYDRLFIKHVVIHEFERDINDSEKLTIDRYNQRSIFHRTKEKIATIFSGLL